ncbi:MAG: hypothetical protein Q8O56_01010 [Solirubrobacteraceae bacterium]|nr:hypothetical protein [Solirubrobacteraceae bacterium]
MADVRDAGALGGTLDEADPPRWLDVDPLGRDEALAMRGSGWGVDPDETRRARVPEP